MHASTADLPAMLIGEYEGEHDETMPVVARNMGLVAS